MGQAGPFLTTERLGLWLPAVSDHEALYRMVEPAEVREFLGPQEASLADSFARLLRNAGSWALYGYGVLIVREKASPDLVASCGLFHSWRGFGHELNDVPEAGWIVAREHWGKGYALEAMRAVLAWFDVEHAARRTACMIDEGHGASEMVARKLGFNQYARHAPDEVKPLVLYERFDPAGR